jgi:CheY-like chemotaxis protein
MKSGIVVQTPVEVLLVEDTPGDVRLAQEAFRDSSRPVRLHLATDGAEAMAFLSREGAYVDAPRPDLILLDVNMPKMNGWQVLAAIKADPSLKVIPTIILTTSDEEADIVMSYQLQANCHLRKPKHWDPSDNFIRSINAFWLTNAKLPPQSDTNEAIR